MTTKPFALFLPYRYCLGIAAWHLLPSRAMQAIAAFVCGFWWEQGDGILIRTPYRQDIIDGGPVTLRRQSGPHLPFWDRDIELMVVSHPIPTITAAYSMCWNASKASPCKVWTHPMLSTPNFWKNSPRVHSHHVYSWTTRIRMGGSLTLISVLDRTLGAYKNMNNSSVVGLLRFKDISDAWGHWGPRRKAPIAQQHNLAADVLKVGHHGSKTLPPKPIEGSKPDYAVISVGANNGGHPHPTVVQRLQEHRATIIVLTKMAISYDEWWYRYSF